MDDKTRKRQLSSFETACRNAGLKLTHQRQEIYFELANATDHPSAETLHQRLLERIPTLSLDTVYRTLATFNLHGLVQKVDTVESQARYEVTYKRHHHLVCRECREIIDFHWPSIDAAALPDEIKSWGKVDSKNVVVYGVCNKCQK